MDSILAPRTFDLVIPSLPTLKHLLPARMFIEAKMKLAVPDSVLRLIQLADDGSPKHQRFLARLMALNEEQNRRFAGPEGMIYPGIRQITRRIRQHLEAMQAAELLILITEADEDPEVANAFAESFEHSRNYIALSPRKNFVRDFFVRVISFAKKTGGLIVDGTGAFFHRACNFIAGLQIPEKADAIVKRKQDFVAKYFRFPGGRATRCFVGIAVAIAGAKFFSWSIVGIGLAFIDP